MFVGKTLICLTAHVIEKGSSGCLMDSGDGQSSVTGQETLGEHLVSAQHNGTVSFTSELWSSVLDQLGSGLVACVPGGIQITRKARSMS